MFKKLYTITVASEKCCDGEALLQEGEKEEKCVAFAAVQKKRGRGTFVVRILEIFILFQRLQVQIFNEVKIFNIYILRMICGAFKKRSHQILSNLAVR